MQETYTVKKGDTLYGISNQFGVSVSDLASINNLSPNVTLQVGKVLIIPQKEGSNPSTFFIYTVKKGDNLYNIAKTYNTTVNELIKINNLKTNNLSIGDKLKIPETYTPENNIKLPNYINYTIKQNDNLYSIAKKYNITVDEIIKDNALKSNNLTIGQILKIRIKENNEIIEECYGEDYNPTNIEENNLYTVKKGDSLYSISQQYSTTVDNLKKTNNLATNNLTIGQVLKIPISNTSNNYIVKKGDTLYSIAKKYNTTKDIIKTKNNLNSDLLTIGQILKI